MKPTGCPTMSPCSVCVSVCVMSCVQCLVSTNIWVGRGVQNAATKMLEVWQAHHTLTSTSTTSIPQLFQQQQQQQHQQIKHLNQQLKNQDIVQQSSTPTLHTGNSIIVPAYRDKKVNITVAFHIDH